MTFPFWIKVFLVTLPFSWLFIGILGTKMKTYIVTSIALLLTSFLAFLGWQANFQLITISYLEGITMGLIPIIWVIVTAVFTYEVSVRTTAMKNIQQFLEQISPEPAIQAIIIAFGFGGFLESVAGFGTAVAIPTAMLVGIGFDPMKAILISLVANSVPVAFGALGIPVIVLSKITELPVEQLTPTIAWQLFPFSFLIPLLIVGIAKGKQKIPKKVWGESLLFGMIFSVIQIVVAIFIGPELVAVLASLGIVLTGILLRWRIVKGNLGSMVKPIAPYALLLVFVLITRLIPFNWFKTFPFVISWNIQNHTFSIEWLTTPGTLLFISTVLGGIIQGASWKSLSDAFLFSINKLKTSMITIISLVIMAKLMGNTPMIADLSLALAKVSGKLFPFLSPILGALGTFITGSDTSSNILLGKLQRDTAIHLNLDPVWVSAANTSGATAGKMISPHSITVASSTVGLQGSEGKILSSSLRFCLGYACLLGIFVGIVAL